MRRVIRSKTGAPSPALALHAPLYTISKSYQYSNEAATPLPLPPAPAAVPLPAAFGRAFCFDCSGLLFRNLWARKSLVFVYRSAWTMATRHHSGWNICIDRSLCVCVCVPVLVTRRARQATGYTTANAADNRPKCEAIEI